MHVDIYVFFFSSRRRHTRFDCDWSSDVCSSDLWLGTLWGARIQFTVPMLNALAFVSMFVIGGLSGVIMAPMPVDTSIHGTNFLVAHIHYVAFWGSIFGAFAPVIYPFPKMICRMADSSA